MRRRKRGAGIEQHDGFVRHKHVHTRQGKVNDRAVVCQQPEGVGFVHGGDGDNVVLVGRVTQRRIGVLVAGCHYHYRITGNCLGNGIIQRVKRVVFIIAAQAQVNNVRTVVERIVNALGSVCHFSVSVFVHNLDGQNFHIGGGAVGDNAAHLGPVVLVIVKIRIVADKIIAVFGVTSLQIAVGLFDAGIQHRNLDLREFFSAAFQFFLQLIQSHALNTPAHVSRKIIA